VRAFVAARADDDSGSTERMPRILDAAALTVVLMLSFTVLVMPAYSRLRCDFLSCRLSSR
jgi:hypothetical protein